MAYIGQPVPSTVVDIGQLKVSDGKSVDVTVPAAAGTVAGAFCVLDGFFGLALQTIVAAENTAGATISLQIEQAEYVTDQIDKTKAFVKGAALYFDPSKGLFTDDATVSGSFMVGRVSDAKSAESTIQFILYPQTGATKA